MSKFRSLVAAGLLFISSQAGAITDVGKVCLQDDYGKVYGFHIFLQNESFIAFGISHDFKFYKNERCFIQPIVVAGWYRAEENQANFSIDVLGGDYYCPNRTLHLQADYSIPAIWGSQQQGKEFESVEMEIVSCPDNN